MGYKLPYIFLAILIIITDTNGLMVNIAPIPATVILGDNLIVTSTITKTVSESWKAFTFYVVDGDTNTACRGAFYSASSACSDGFGCSYGFGFTCNYTHFNLQLNNVGLSLIGLSIYAEVTITGSPKVKSLSTTIEVKIPLEGVLLTPNGSITKTESETQVFKCVARSLPIASLSWYLSGSILPTSSPPVTTTDTVTSTYTYIAKKGDNGIRLSCTAVYDSTSFTKDALINVHYRPTVTVSPNINSFRVLENTTNLILTCNVTDANPAVTSFTWKKDGSTIPGVAGIYTIPTVYRAHTGSYTCSAANSVGSSDPSATIQLEVLYGIQLDSIKKKEPVEGRRFTVPCSGQSNPAISDDDVTWTKQNNNSFRLKGKNLAIDNINRVDSGTYACFVVIKLIPTFSQPINVTGTTTVEVNVLYRPQVTISPTYPQYKVIENTTNIMLECTVDNANPAVTSYRWHKDGSLIDGSNDTSFTISTVRRSHTGRYACDATNSVGSSDLSADVQLTVLYGVDIYTYGQKDPTESTQLLVFCNVSSYPKVSNNDVTWTKQNNLTFIKKEQQLLIENVNRIDSGTYICSVILELIPTLGQTVNVTGTTTVEVNVLYKPTVTISPEYKHYNVIENTSNLHLTCNVTDANPAVTSYRWYKGSSLISNFATYTIPTILRSHSGSYTCDATNEVNTSIPSSAVILNILYGVKLNPINKTNQTEGTQLTIPCSGQSNPMMTNNDVEWSKLNNNTFSRVGLQLVIDNVNRLDRGSYLCSAVIQLTPSVGNPVNVTGSTTVDVNVLYRPDVTVTPDINPYHVKENMSNLLFTCNVTDAYPAASSYRWFKDGVKVWTSETYNIPTVYRSHTGSYTCDAKNTVGYADPSQALRLDVQYGVSLELSRTDISIKESDRWDLSCIGDGNPLPNITCVYGYNGTTVGEQKHNVTSISVENANCMDTGLYTCSGNNTIGESVSKSAEIEVACKPRTNDNVKEYTIFINATDKSLNISTTFISFPFSDISWFRELSDGNLTDIDSEFKSSTMSSDLQYETISILQKDQLNQDEFGIYFVNASNIYGTFLLKYHVVAKRAPDPPSNITASCDVTSIGVTWISRFNGGENQSFRIIIVNNYSNKTISKGDIADKGKDTIMNEEKASLSPDTLFFITIEAENVYGTSISTQTANCTTKKNIEDDNTVSSALVGGISGSISAMLILFIAIGGLYLWRGRQNGGGNKELINRGLEETEAEEDGLKENPLYVTSEEASNNKLGPVYGVVNKQKQKKKNTRFDGYDEQGAGHSLVQKSNTHGKKNEKEKKGKTDSKNAVNYNDIELGSVYENSAKVLNYKSSEELYANAEEQANGLTLPNVYSPQKNKDGLIYADLDLIPEPSGKKFVIRGLENRTNYAIIDLSKKAEPLPSDDEDEDNNTGKSPDNEGNE